MTFCQWWSLVEACIIGLLVGYYVYPDIRARMMFRKIDKNIDHLLNDMYGEKQ